VELYPFSKVFVFLVGYSFFPSTSYLFTIYLFLFIWVYIICISIPSIYIIGISIPSIYIIKLSKSFYYFTSVPSCHHLMLNYYLLSIYICIFLFISSYLSIYIHQIHYLNHLSSTKRFFICRLLCISIDSISDWMLLSRTLHIQS
jgi:hypothetical protein